MGSSRRLKACRVTAAALIAALLLSLLSACGAEKTAEVELSYDPAPVRLVYGDDFYNKATLAPAVFTVDGKAGDASGIEYVSSDPSVCSVNGSRVTANGEGTVTVTARYAGTEAALTVEVTARLAQMTVTDETAVKRFGRVDEKDGAILFDNTASGFEVNFIGKALIADLDVLDANNALRVTVDGGEPSVIPLEAGRKLYTLVSLEQAGMHTVRVLKRTEQRYGTVALKGLVCDDAFIKAEKPSELFIEVYGDSITCGWGLEGTNDQQNSPALQDGTATYAVKACEAVGADFSVIAYSGISLALRRWLPEFDIPAIMDLYSTVNRKTWDFSRRKADVVIVNLGTNDKGGVDAGMGTADDFEEAYKAFLDRLYTVYPGTKAVCLYGAMDYSADMLGAIQNAVAYAKQGGNEAWFLQLTSNMQGAAAHPDRTAHAINGNKLAAFLTDNVL